MQVTPFTSTTPTAGATNSNPSTKSGSLGDPTSLFISMLSAELKSQDPTSPLDPSQMVQQIVSISQLDQLIQINQGLQGVEAPATTSTQAS
jgi:flagellar basal-body rod modification protein FlgD